MSGKENGPRVKPGVTGVKPGDGSLVARGDTHRHAGYRIKSGTGFDPVSIFGCRKEDGPRVKPGVTGVKPGVTGVKPGVTGVW